MNFTREPIIETVITPKEGSRLVVRSSKVAGLEEHTIEALEVVSFGQALFFRSQERPKCFLLPVSDYEVLEVRETRMVLKAGPLEKGVKSGGGRESSAKKEKPEEELLVMETYGEEDIQPAAEESKETPPQELKSEKKRDRHRRRRRKGKLEGKEETLPTDDLGESYAEEGERPTFTSLIPPPSTLISESMASYKTNPEYSKTFIQQESDFPPPPPLLEDV